MENTKYKNAFLIVLYNTSLSESASLKTLISNCSRSVSEDSCIIIWNNGPERISNNISIENSKFSIHYKETLGNLPLSKIYNLFLQTVFADRYIILDDDSHLSREYLDDLNEIGDMSLGLPLVYDKGRRISPNVDKKYLQRPSAIASGMVISKVLKTELIRKYKMPFDERFCLYGVDFSFIQRTIKINANILLLSRIEHSKSTIIGDPNFIPIFRKKELGYSIGLKVRYYFDFKSFSVLFKSLFFYIIKNNYRVYFPAILHTLIHGKHPRC